MNVFRFRSLEELAPYSDRWDDLAADVPFRGWTWLSTWWRHYGGDQQSPRRSLYVLGVFDQAESLVGLAPWYLETSATYGRVLRFLGSGEVCSDHLAILCRRGVEDRVAETIARWLFDVSFPGTGHDPRDEWDLLELSGVDASEATVAALGDHLEEQGATVRRHAGPNCWMIDLPDDWSDYLHRLSKSHAKQLRRIERRLIEPGRLKLRTVCRMEQLPATVDRLIDLHQRRWRSRGQRGCFASDRFAAFHREVMSALLRAGQLQLHEVELDGQVVAAEYHLAGGGTIYAYQSGIDPQFIDQSPGQLANMLAIRRAIEQGYRGIDFLRGDEPYKAHWRAEPQPGIELRAVPARVAAQFRHGVRAAGQSVKQWIKSGLRIIGARDGRNQV